MGRKKTRCEECGRRKATYFCPVCGTIYCDNCESMGQGQCDICAPGLEPIVEEKKAKKKRR